MKQYDSYRNSGVEWIGRVPSHWETAKIKYSFNIYAGATPKTEKEEFWDGDIVWVTPADYKTSDKFVSRGQRTITKAGYNSCNTQIVPKGSLIFSKRAPIGTVAISSNELCTNQGCLSCVPKLANVSYYYYCASIASEYFDLLGSGATFKEISAASFSNVKFPCPPLAEQQAIASYLDAQTARIDSIIEAREKKIKLLEELRVAIISKAVTKGIRKNVETKDSGIEWIGKIPKHWEVRRLKHMGNAENGLTYSPNDVCEEPGILVLRSSNIQNDRIDLNDKVYVKSVPDNLKVKKGDIIICSRNGSVSLVGKSALVEDDINATFGAFMIRFNTQFHFKYIYFLVSEVSKHYKGLFSTTTINQLTLGMFSQMYAPLAPSLEEQKEIAEYIIRKTSQIEKGMLKARSEIELLKEYRASLITEVVTGKRKVI